MMIAMLWFSWYQRAVLFLEAHLLPCPSIKYLHIQCPGCGLQRGVIALLRGHLQESFMMYPATLPIIILLLFLLLHLKCKFTNGSLLLRGIYLFCAAVMVVQYFYKIASHQLIVP